MWACVVHIILATVGLRFNCDLGCLSGCCQRLRFMSSSSAAPFFPKSETSEPEDRRDASYDVQERRRRRPCLLGHLTPSAAIAGHQALHVRGRCGDVETGTRPSRGELQLVLLHQLLDEAIEGDGDAIASKQRGK